MRKGTRFIAFGLFMIAISACGSKESENVANNPKPKPMAAPFRFQRTIEVKPGLLYDVLTWGRGKDSTSAYLLLRSDSTHQKFKATVAGELTGKPVDAWDMDLDTDGNPEIALQVQLADQLTDLYIYEFDQLGNSSVIRFPALSEKARKGFKGKDDIYIKDGNLRRDFLYQDPEDQKAKPRKRTLEYRLFKNTLSIQEIENNAKK